MFRQIGRVAIGLGMDFGELSRAVNLNQVALDGTVKRASNSRYAVSRKVKLEQKLAALDQQVQGLMDEALATDQKENELFGESSPTQLPRGLRDLKARQQRLEKAMKKVPAIENLRESFGPDAVKELLADSAFNTGSNLDALKTAGIQPWMPAKHSAVAPEIFPG